MTKAIGCPKYNKINLQLIAKIIIGILVFFINVWNLSKLNQICVIDDEFGYWGTAAHFAGYDWTGLSGTSPYYGFGIGFLYAFLFKIFNNITLMYKSAIILNALLLVATFYLSISCFNKIFPRINKYFVILFSLFITLYPNNLVQSQIAWTETLLYFWFWVTFYLFIRISEKATIWNVAFWGFWLLYGLMIHQRTLGVVCSGILLIIFLKIFNKLSWKHLLSFFIPLIVSAAMFLYIKSYLNNNFWKTFDLDVAELNNLSGQLEKVVQIFSIDGIKTFFYSVCGKAFYLIIASFFTVIPFLIYIGKNLWELAKNYFKNKIFIFDMHKCICVFLLFAFISTFLISAIFMLNFTSRADTYLYGRYNEFIIGPVILIGLGAIYQCKNKWTMFSWIIGITIIISWVVHRALNNYEFTAFYVTNCVGLGEDFIRVNELGHVAYSQLIKNFIIAFIILILISNKCREKISYLISCLLVVSIFWYPSVLYNRQNTYNMQEIFSKDITDISQIILETDNNYPVYYIADGRNPDSFREDVYERHIKYLQFYLFEKTIEIKKYSSLYSEEAYYIVRKESSCYTDMLLDDYDLVYENDLYGLFLTKSGDYNVLVENYIYSTY